MRVEKAFQVSETSRLTCSQMTSGEGHPTDSRFTPRLSLGLWFRRMSQQQSNFLALMNVGGSGTGHVLGTETQTIGLKVF